MLYIWLDGINMFLSHEQADLMNKYHITILWQVYVTQKVKVFTNTNNTQIIIFLIKIVLHMYNNRHSYCSLIC